MNFVPSYRDPADKFTTAEIGLGNRNLDEESSGTGKGIFEKGSVETSEHVTPSEIQEKKV